MGKVTYTNTPDRVEQAEIRDAHGVRLVTDAEEGTGVNALPGGVYGYTYSPGLINAPLFKARRYRTYETHKLASGETFLVAYADAETAAQVASAPEDVTVLAKPEPSSDDSVIVKIPYSRIRQSSQYSAPNQDGITVTLAPANHPVTG
jgi:hypothetical protein